LDFIVRVDTARIGFWDGIVFGLAIPGTSAFLLNTGMSIERNRKE